MYDSPNILLYMKFTMQMKCHVLSQCRSIFFPKRKCSLWNRSPCPLLLLKFWCDNMKMNYLTLIKLLPFSDFFLSISDWLFNWYPIRYEGPVKLIKLIINVRWLSCEWFYTFEPLCFFKRLSFLVTPSVLCCYPLWL